MPKLERHLLLNFEHMFFLLFLLLLLELTAIKPHHKYKMHFTLTRKLRANGEKCCGGTFFMIWNPAGNYNVYARKNGALCKYAR